MYQRLFQAELNRNVDGLLKEVEANPSMLHAVALEGGDNPLHMVCLAGHLNFAATIVKLMPGFTRELNQDGFSPLHIAASCGRIEIVKELLQVDPDLCLLEGKNRKIPLHLAVAKGNAEVTKLLLSGSESIECTTAKGENALHLAVKYNQFKVFQVLIQHLKQVNKEALLNSKDFHGNTGLHLAVCRKQFEVVDHILNGGVISMDKVELNSLNNNDLTPLDMLQTEAVDRDIHQILIQAGATNLLSPAFIQEQQPDSHPRHGSHSDINIIGYKKLMASYKKLMASPIEIRNALLVILVLITSATYQAALSPPSGLWQDDLILSDVNNSSSSAIINTMATKLHKAGLSIMLTHNPAIFNAFLFPNSIGFYVSLQMIIMLTKGFPFQKQLCSLIFALQASYTWGVLGIIPKNSGLKNANSNTTQERV